MILLRRIHLYAGLFLLPWVFLYGITGAMYNHYGLFPEATFAGVSATALTDTAVTDFPSTKRLAQQVVEALQAAAPDSEIVLDESHDAEYVNDVILQVNDGKAKHMVHIDPVEKSAWVASTTGESFAPKPLLDKVKNVSIHPSPYEQAKATVPAILREAGINTDASPQPQGWCKLNFLVTVDGEPARVTYVLRDGHVDVTKYAGEPGMSPRAVFLRLHTTHGRSPHWNGRMFWSLIIDVMAIAMVTWGVTGLIMWWQIKRTRIIGAAVIAFSIGTAAMMYMGMIHFYATSKL